jgi:hypothetical protein
MLRGTLKGNSCETGSGNLPGPCSDILMKQRRGSAYYKNNPLKVLNSKYNTFSSTPLGGDININTPGYEDAPGTNVMTPDIDLPDLKRELIGGKNKSSDEIVRNVINGKPPVAVSASPLAGFVSKENFPTEEELILRQKIIIAVIVLWALFFIGSVIYLNFIRRK